MIVQTVCGIISLDFNTLDTTMQEYILTIKDVEGNTQDLKTFADGIAVLGISVTKMSSCPYLIISSLSPNFCPKM
mgnify:CR=1 FL=1